MTPAVGKRTPAASPLRINDAVLARLARDSPIAIVVSVREDGCILDVNESFARLFGYGRDDLIGQSSTALGLWTDPTQRAALVAALSSGQSLRDFETTVRTNSGVFRRVLATVSEVEIDGTACLLTQLYDVTSYRQAQIRFQALIEQLPVVTYVLAVDAPSTMTYISPQGGDGARLLL